MASVFQAAAFTAAQAVSAVEDTASLPTPRTTEPCAPTAEPRRGEAEPNEQRAKLAFIITFNEQHAARLGDKCLLDRAQCSPQALQMTAKGEEILNKIHRARAALDKVEGS